MTGIFVRIKREGKWQAIEFDELTDPELDEFIAHKLQPLNDPDVGKNQTSAAATEGWAWAKSLAQFIRDHVRAVDRGDGTLKLNLPLSREIGIDDGSNQ